MTLILLALVALEGQQDASAITGELIQKLGSDRVEEREAAIRSLTELGEPAREALKQATAAGDPEIAGRARQILTVLDTYAMLEELLAKYRAFGMPLPPAGAPLLRFKTDRDRWGPNGKLPPQYGLGFLVRKARGNTPGLVLRGTEEQWEDDRPGMSKEVQPLSGMEKDLDGEVQECIFPLNTGLASAVQFKARGWNEFALLVLKESLKQGAGRGVLPQPPNQPPRTAFAFMAWTWFANQLVQPATDRAGIARHMKSLLADEPKLRTKFNQALFDSLEAALVPSQADPGTVDAAIDDLVNVAGTVSRHRRGEPDPRYLKVLLLGFDAVPGLIQHLDDRRLTRSVMEGFNNFNSYIRRFHEIASDLLKGIAGDDLGSNWLRRQQGWAVRKQDAEEWWNKAQVQAEEPYLVSHVFPTDPKAGGPNEPVIQIIAKKYPARLPEIYRSLLQDHPNLQSWPLAAQVRMSALSKEKKVELFVQASKHPNLEHRRAAFGELRELDEPLFVNLLIETLKALPTTPAEPYWWCTEGYFAHLVVKTADPRAWDALDQAARRADPGLRMQLLDAMTSGRSDESQLRERIHFLAGFLEDRTVRDVTSNPAKFEGPSAGNEFPRIEIRDYAATRLASLLKVGLWAKPDWGDAQWAELRAQVKHALKRP